MKTYTFSETVETPTDDAGMSLLAKGIQATQRQIQRWEGKQPENVEKAKAFLQLQEAARKQYRSEAPRSVVHETAKTNQAALLKQQKKMELETKKFAEMSLTQSQLAVDATSSSDDVNSSLAAAQDAFNKAKEDSQQPPKKVPKRTHRTKGDPEVQAINEETERRLQAIAEGKASAHVHQKIPFI